MLGTGTGTRTRSRVASPFSLVLALGALACAGARADELITLGRGDAPIQEVTVYAGQALVKRVASFEAKDAGLAKVVLAKLPSQVQGESVRIRSEAGLTLLGTRVVPRPVRESSLPAIQALEAERRDIEERRVALRDEVAVRAATLAQIAKIRGAQANEQAAWLKADPDVLSRLLDWAEMRERGALDEKRKREKELGELDEAYELAGRKLAALSGGGGDEQDVEVELSVGKPGRYRIGLEYVTSGASWRPRYDLRADQDAKAIDATYQGIVSQRTGEDWEGVKLALSTARPELGARPPELAQATLGVGYGAVGMSGTSKSPILNSVPDARARFGGEEVSKAKVGYNWSNEVETAEVEARGATVAFAIPTPETIPSDGKDKRTTIGKSTWKTENRHVTVPKLSPFAYLQSRVTNAFAFPLLAGEASVYFGQDYVGKSRVDLVPAGEKFDVHLGVDERVRVERKTERRFRDTKGLFTTDVRERYEFKIPIKNARPEAIRITVIDQVPVSVHEDIRVEDVSWTPEVVRGAEGEKPPRGRRDDPTGERRWDLSIPAKGEAAVTLGYTVRFPERLEGVVAGLER